MTNQRPGKFRQRRLRRGSLYVPVMGVTLIVAMIGLCAMQLVRLERRGATARQEMAEARLLARSGIEMAVNWISTNENWRTSIIHNTESSTVALGKGTFSWLLYDEDGDLADEETDVVLVKGIGRVGDTVQIESVLLTPAGAALTCLEVAAQAGSDVTFASGTDTTGSGIISCNNTMTSSGAPKLYLNMEAVNGFTGSFGPGSTSSGVPPRQMPDPSNVFQYYLANGTNINVTDLPKWGGEPALQFQLLSPANNPFGSGETNSQGIYIIDLKGAVLWLRNCRIVGTLVLLNPGRVEVYTDVNWEPAVPNFPAMLVGGDVTFQIESDMQMQENNVSLNPIGTPYEGVEDNDTHDYYPVIVKGLVYATGNLRVVWGKTAIDGVVVAGQVIDLDADLDLQYDKNLLNNPPPGFSGGDVMKISPGSWQRATF